VLNFEGQKIDGDAFSVNMKKELAKEVSARNLPIYECKLDNGELKYIIPMRGKGLWGPIWGYVALNEDKKTIYGASFDHQAETPGLGAEISQDFFTKQFAGKEILKNGTVTFEVVKGKAAPGNKYAVDGVSGGTITSKGLENMMLENLGAYERFLKN
jgi:Na+-transporting NADH:ubiquinone oxidoreductase subunit C